MKLSAGDYLTLVAVATAIGVSVVALRTREARDPGTAPAAGARRVGDERWSAVLQGGHWIGPADAEVKILEFGDFTCGHCGTLFFTLEDLRKHCPENVALIYKHFVNPVGSGADLALASECAAEQEQFERFYAQVFRAQWRPVITTRELREFAGTIGVPDLPRFSDCLEDRLHAEKIQHDGNLARRIGAEGTPTLIINGMPMSSGALSLQTLDRIVVASLRRRDSMLGGLAIHAGSTDHRLRRRLSVASLSLAASVLMSCGEIVQPPSAPSLLSGDLASSSLTAQTLLSRYLALGTSNSQGVQSAGISASGQNAAWPAELARRAGVPFRVPLLKDPGCGPPLLPPLAADILLVGAFGDDLVTAVMETCAPLRDGVSLPAGNLAISGATARSALRTTPESAMAASARKGELYSRVLLPGQTQVSAMLASQPTFVSVELAANEVLPASTGRFSATTPFEIWQPVYDSILALVQTTGAGAVLVGLPNDAANFPSIRRAREFFSQAPYLLALGIQVSLNCYFSPNFVFVPGYVLTLLSQSPTTATCADVPGAADYVLTPSDRNAINGLMARMNAHIQARANENGWAYFSLEALYGLPKPAFNMYNVLFSSTPFGPHISLDGVHPSASGQAILAAAAAQAINARYGVAIP